MRHDYYGDYHHGTPVLAWLFLVLLLILLALAAYAVFRAVRTPATGTTAVVAAGPRAAGDDALGVVRLRYARGEITRDEFLQASADLGGEPPPATGR